MCQRTLPSSSTGAADATNSKADTSLHSSKVVYTDTSTYASNRVGRPQYGQQLPCYSSGDTSLHHHKAAAIQYAYKHTQAGSNVGLSLALPAHNCAHEVCIHNRNQATQALSWAQQRFAIFTCTVIAEA